MKPLAPMSPARIKWEESLQSIICERAECSNGDAQGIIEANQEIVDTCYADDRTPADAAEAIGLQPAPDEDEPFLTCSTQPSLTRAKEAAKALDDQMREIANGKRKPVNLSIGNLTDVIVFVRNATKGA